MAGGSIQFERGGSPERSPLIPQHPPTSHPVSGPVPRPPSPQAPPQNADAPGDSEGGNQSAHVHQPQQDPSPLRPAETTKKRFGVFVVVFLIVAFIVFCGRPSRIEELNKATARMREQQEELDKATARMREQQEAMRKEADHLESERIVSRNESNRLEKERLKMEGERDTLESAIRRSKLGRLRLEREKQQLEDERQLLEQEREALKDERQSLEQEREALKDERQSFEQEREALKGERRLMEQEREALKEERERWEKAREDRVPQGAFWDRVLPAPDCCAYGKREYWGILENIPKGWTDMDACMNMPVGIRGVTIRRPYRCAYAKGSPHIHGYWMVDWGQPDCKPWHQNVTDEGCTNPGSRIRRVEARVMGINDKPEQDWRLLCETTPFTWKRVTYDNPTQCVAGWLGKKYAMWEVPDRRC